MSITYSFHVATEQTAEQVRGLLGVAPDGALANAYGPGHPAYVLVKPMTPDPVEDSAYRAAYGFAPRVAVTVELDKHATDEESQEQPVMAVLRALASRLTNDMYANYLGDYPVLLRRRGALILDREWVRQRPWFPRVLGQTYEVAELVDPYSEPA